MNQKVEVDLTDMEKKRALLLKTLCKTYATARAQKLPTLLITLEEAHEFLDPNKQRTIFSDIALTYRKYRVGA